MITSRLAECHDTCLDVEGPDNHVANVNPIENTTPTQWRIDCDSCGTCIAAGIPTKADARDLAVSHVSMTSDLYWLFRSEGDD